MNKKISLVLSTQGNIKALKRTIESVQNICDEIVIGDLCVFKEDSDAIWDMRNDFNIRVIKLPFNYIYENGFSETLNKISDSASNDLCLYLNVGEVPDGGQVALRLINEKFSDYNAYAINHGQEKHTWVRAWNKAKLKWDGLIHEEIVSDKEEKKLCPYYIFQFKDTDKDLDDPFKAKIFDDIKNLVYFNQYLKLVKYPELKGITNDWWINFAKENCNSMKERMESKGKRFQAFVNGDLGMYLQDAYTNKEFEKEIFESSKLIEFQNSKKSL